MKKSNRILLWAYVAICIITTGTTGRLLFQDRQKFWHRQARETFSVALTEELQKWKAFDVYVNSSGNWKLQDNSINLKQEPIKISLRNEWGAKDFWIPYEKYTHNIEPSDDIKGMHTYLLHVSPLKADSLNLFWKNRLNKAGFTGTTTVRISVTDW